MAITRRRPTTRATKMSSASKTFPLGSQVKVPFGTRTFDAKVLENHMDRVTVEITIEGASEPLVTSFRSDEIQNPNSD